MQNKDKLMRYRISQLAEFERDWLNLFSSEPFRINF